MSPLVWAAALVWSAIFAVKATAYDPTDGDLWWQRALGDAVLQHHAIPAVLGSATYTAPDAPWVAHEWLFSTAYAWCVSHHHVVAFELALAACAAATMLLVAARATALGGGRYAGLAAIACGAALTESYGVRAQVAAWPLLALFLVVFERPGRVRFLALPVAIVWANVHASVVLAPALACLGLLDTRRPAAERIGMLAGVAAAVLCTPFGVELPLMALRWTFDPDASFITEWARPRFSDWPFLVGGVLPAAVLFADVRARALDASQRVTAVVLVIAMIDHGRNIATAAIVIVPYAARVLQTLTGPGRTRRWTRSDAGLVALAALGAAFVAFQAGRATKPPYPARPAVAAARALPGAQRVYCEDFSWCSLFADDPSVRVYIDGRTDAYPHRVFAGWDDVRTAKNGWDRALAADGTTTILAWSHGVLVSAAKHSPEWRTAYADPTITVFVRSPAAR